VIRRMSIFYPPRHSLAGTPATLALLLPAARRSDALIKRTRNRGGMAGCERCSNVLAYPAPVAGSISCPLVPMGDSLTGKTGALLALEVIL
jgi:hypothetical protein